MYKKSNRTIAVLIGWVVSYFVVTNFFQDTWIYLLFVVGIFLIGIFLVVFIIKETNQRKQVERSKKDQ